MAAKLGPGERARSLRAAEIDEPASHGWTCERWLEFYSLIERTPCAA